MPLCHTKTVHFIRHGEGWHNVGLANADAHLTPRGWQQAHALGRHMREHVATAGVQLVVVSPLMRTLETAAGVFGEEESGSAGSAGDILMVAQGEAAEVRVAHAAMRQRRGVTYIANELCRERLGPSSCDGRRSRSEAAAAFSGVDFSLIDDDKDPHWRPGNVEPEEAVVLRGRQFLQWLMTLPATNIAVVTHSAFLFFTLSGFGVENVRPVRERLQRWYENCEMRSVVLGDGGTVVGLASPSPTLDADFRGGHAMVEAQKALVEAEGKSMEVNSNGGGGSNGGAK
jgi:broad specificity phosphatase PhoE